jgi:hypothetical protein
MIMYIQSAKIRSRCAPRDVRREGYKGLLHRGLYAIFSLLDTLKPSLIIIIGCSFNILDTRKSAVRVISFLAQSMKLTIVLLFFITIRVMLLFFSEVMSYFNAATSVFQNKRFP